MFTSYGVQRFTCFMFQINMFKLTIQYRMLYNHHISTSDIGNLTSLTQKKTVHCIGLVCTHLIKSFTTVHNHTDGLSVFE